MPSSQKQGALPSQIYALHGFLGRAEDWQAFEQIDHPVRLEHAELNLWQWAQAFNTSLPNLPEKRILLGYSMGGRLAMHALLDDPSKWSGAIFIAAHPGLSSADERAARFQNDQQWAARFQHSSWSDLMNAWNANLVFGGRSGSIRKEIDFDRKELQKQLLNWSLGKQEPLLPHLKVLAVPTLYLAGQLDHKFCQVAQAFKAFAKVCIIPDCAHRVPWEKPLRFIAEVNQFITQLA